MTAPEETGREPEENIIKTRRGGGWSLSSKYQDKFFKEAGFRENVVTFERQKLKKNRHIKISS